MNGDDTIAICIDGWKHLKKVETSIEDEPCSGRHWFNHWHKSSASGQIDSHR